jgi:hypothetical protein
MVCPPATSEAGARCPRFGLVVVATTSCCDNKVQMIRPVDSENFKFQIENRSCIVGASSTNFFPNGIYIHKMGRLNMY